MVLRELVESNGDKKIAAMKLEISTRTLSNYCREIGEEDPSFPYYKPRYQGACKETPFHLCELPSNQERLRYADHPEWGARKGSESQDQY